MSIIGDIYRIIHDIILRKPTYFSWVIGGEVAASARPSHKNSIRWLRMEGVQAILTLTEDPVQRYWLEDEKMISRHIPITDHSLPTNEQIALALEFIDSNLAEGRGVLIHCAAGVGRTGVVLAAHLMKRFKTTPEEAIRMLRVTRPHSIETQQEEAISIYSKYRR